MSEWADSAIQAQCWNLSGNELVYNSSVKACSESSQLTEPLWTDPCLQSGIRAHEMIPTQEKKEKKKAQAEEWFEEPSPKNPRMQGKSHHQQRCSEETLFLHTTVSHRIEFEI